jgi:hypothetical protein
VSKLFRNKRKKEKMKRKRKKRGEFGGAGGCSWAAVGGRTVGVEIYKKDDGGFYGRAPGIIVKRIDGLYAIYYYYTSLSLSLSNARLLLDFFLSADTNPYALFIYIQLRLCVMCVYRCL